MEWMRVLLSRCLSLFSGQRLDKELDEELRAHIELAIDENLKRGMPEAEARRAAMLSFGSLTQTKEQYRELQRPPLLQAIAMDIRYSLRQLRKSPAFTATAVLTLGFGIGATTAIFSLVNAVLLRPLPFPEQDRLVWLKQQDHSLPGVVQESLSYPDYFDWRAQNHSFSGIASYEGGGVTFEIEGESRRLDAQMVSANFFRVLGVAPMLGRDFGWDDEKPGNRTAMLSYSLWQSAFGSAKSVVGRTIRLDDHTYVVAGVMPKKFRFPLENPAPALWLSFADDAEGPNPKTGQRGYDLLSVFGRLKPGVTIERARVDLSLIANNLSREYPDSNKWYTSALIEPELLHLVGDTKQALRVLSGAVLLVLLIACANVAGLLLARAPKRATEFALRVAIGASRAQIIRQSLVESMALSLCGGIAGVALACGLLRGMVRWMPLDIPRVEDATIDGSVLVFAVLVSVITGLLFGVLPAWRVSQLEPIQALREGTRKVAGDRGQHSLHNGLVVAQTAIGLILLLSSGLLIRSFVRILDVDPGFEPKHVLTARMRVRVPFDRMNDDRHVQFYSQLLTRLSALPGVQAASAGWPLPMSGSDATISFTIEGRPLAEGDHFSEAIGVVMPGFFEMMRIPLLSGRTFGETDDAKAAPVTIVNRAFTRKYFPGENPIGQLIQVDLGDGVVEHSLREVVGVVGDIKGKGLTVEAQPQYFLPYAQAVITNPFLVIRTIGDPLKAEGALRAAVQEMDNGVPVYQVSTMEDYVSKSVAQPRFQTLLLSCFAGIALMLSSIGLYGLLSYMVEQRMLEIGLRMALGARRSDILSLILRRGLALTLIGLGVGLVISAMVTRLLSGMLYGIRASDPVTFVAVTGFLFLVSLMASSLPAYRAARLDPMRTLREQ